MTGTEIKRRQDEFLDAIAADLMTYGHATALMKLHEWCVISYRELRDLTIEKHEREESQETP